MFVAMNRFKVKKGSEAEFEGAWLNREVHVNKEPGFVAFHLLKGPEAEEFTLYVSHTIWASEKAFQDWTRSESFRMAHKDAGTTRDYYIGGPQFEAFTALQEIKPAA